MSKVYLLCGVPGSGKTWVMKQLEDKFTCIHNDDYLGQYKSMQYRAINDAARKGKPVLADCPFAERPMRDELIHRGLEVVPIFIVEPPHVIQQRYEQREGKPVAQATMTRALSIKDRAVEWGAPFGSSFNVLKHLLEIADGRSKV